MKLIKIHEQPEVGVSHNPRIHKRVLLQKGDVPGVTNVAQAVFPPGEVAGSHQHEDMAEIFTCISGCGEIRINDVGYVFSSGTTVLVDAGETHEIINSGDRDLVVSYLGIMTGA